MSRFADKYNRKGNDADEFRSVVEAWAADCPEVATVLAGSYDASGNVISPPFGIRLFINGGRLKFQISRKDEALSGFGVILNPDNILGSIEAELQNDNVGWKRGSEQNAPY